MPLPTPRAGEDRHDFMERCMADAAVAGEFGEGTEQAAAVCVRQWEGRQTADRPLLPVTPGRQSALAAGPPLGVDRDARVLRGFVVAQAGPFKSEGRGEFDEASLAQIVKLARALPRGLKSRFTHPTMSDDGLGKHLGRARDLRMDKARDARTGKAVKAVRGDLYFDPSASKTPSGDLAGYVMDLAESDPDALSSSLVLEADEELRLHRDGSRKMAEDGRPLPPLWRPKALHATDIVDTGDAVDGLLSAEDFAKALCVGLTPDLARVLRFDNVARLASQMLDGMFAGQGREVVEARCAAWLGRYLQWRFGDPPPPEPTPKLDAHRDRLAALAVAAKAWKE